MGKMETNLCSIMMAHQTRQASAYMYSPRKKITLPCLQPRSQDLSSYRPMERTRGGKVKDPGNEVAVSVV